MTDMTAFDTKTAYDRFTKAAFTDSQAVVLTDQFALVHRDGAATKADLAAQTAHMDNRFAAADARFETMMAKIDARFEAVDARFDTLSAKLDTTVAKVDASNQRLQKSLMQAMLAFAAAFIGLVLTGRIKIG